MGNASSQSELLELLTEKIYIKERGSYDLYQFKRTCVLDSLLAAIHTTYIKHPNVKALLNSDELFRKLMALLHDEKYAEARVLCLMKLKHVKVDHTSKELDFYGSVNQHFFLLDTLVCETFVNPTPLKGSHIYKEIFSFWMTLGDRADPTLILGQCLLPKSLLQVEDEKKRIFALKFLLLGKDNHMTICFQSYKSKWHLYDNDVHKPPFQSFDLESLKDDDICLAGYVNITQGQDYKFGIPETGETAGAKPFDSGASSSIHSDPRLPVEDMEGEDMSSYPLAIPEIGEGLGPKPFHQNQPMFVPKCSNQEQLGEDIEMVSLSSSDSD